MHIHQVRTGEQSSTQPGREDSLSSSPSTWFADFTPEYGCTADGEGAWRAQSEPSALTFMFLIVGSSSKLSPLCLFCSHWVMHFLISSHLSDPPFNHSLPPLPSSEGPKKSIFFCSTQPHPTTRRVHSLLRDFCVETTSTLRLAATNSLSPKL